MAREADPTRHLQPPEFPEVDLGEYMPSTVARQAAAHHRTAPQAPSPGLESALARLEDLLDEETRVLQARDPVDMEDFNRRKSRCLLELTRLARQVAPGAEGVMRPLLERLRTKLDANRSLLDLHMAAAREISDLMANAVHESESDGTYGATAGLRGFTA